MFYVMACEIQGSESDDVSGGGDDPSSVGEGRAHGEGSIEIGSDDGSSLHTSRSSLAGTDEDMEAAPKAASDSSSSASVHISDIDFSDVLMLVSDLDEDDEALSGSDDDKSSCDSMVHLGHSDEDIVAEAMDDVVFAPKKDKADVMLVFSDGAVRYYASSQTLVATCKHHGSRYRLTKTVSHRFNARNPGQGRPLGLLCAWMEAGAAMPHGALHRGVHNALGKGVGVGITHAQRVAARARAMLLAGIELLVDMERPRCIDRAEPEEPGEIH
jgi:hypothetical protein